MSPTKEHLVSAKIVIVSRDGMIEDVFLNEKGQGCVVLDYDGRDFDEIQNYEDIIDELRNDPEIEIMY